MATHRISPDAGTPSPVNPNICDSFQAQLGAQVTFAGVTGIQTITQIAGTTWPFSIASPMTVPNPTTIHIKTTGLNVGTTYPFNVSQQCPSALQKGVTIIN